jgi:Sigma-70, region 4
MADSLSLAFLDLLESLSPEQRAAFLLREVFGEPYERIAEIVGTSEQNARQLAARARVARTLIAGLRALTRSGITWRGEEMNGQPGALFLDREGRNASPLVMESATGWSSGGRRGRLDTQVHTTVWLYHADRSRPRPHLQRTG